MNIGLPAASRVSSGNPPCGLSKSQTSETDESSCSKVGEDSSDRDGRSMSGDPADSIDTSMSWEEDITCCCVSGNSGSKSRSKINSTPFDSVNAPIIKGGRTGRNLAYDTEQIGDEQLRTRLLRNRASAEKSRQRRLKQEAAAHEKLSWLEQTHAALRVENGALRQQMIEMQVCPSSWRLLTYINLLQTIFYLHALSCRPFGTAYPNRGIKAAYTRRFNITPVSILHARYPFDVTLAQRKTAIAFPAS